MTNISSLPDELLINIFNQISNMSHTATCRLVCKSWNSLVERAMLGRPITIRSEMGILQLYTLLTKTPSKQNLMRHLNFESTDAEISMLLRELVPLIFKPNIESLTGTMVGAKFFTLLNCIIDKSSAKFEKLKKITVSSIQDRAYSKFLLHFTDSLETLTIDAGECPEEINWTLFGGIHDTLQNMHSILTHCNHIKTLTVNTHGWDVTGDIEDMLVWSKFAVKKQHGLHTLIVRSQCPAEMLEYLLYKYTNIETIAIDVDLYSDMYLENNMNRIASAIERIPHKELYLTVPKEINFRKVIKYLKNNDYNILIHEVRGNNAVCVKIEGL
ncbi:hypothetical protein BD408DRAFT_433266 [Parasitella parasitica]|nr:hypothetical protein BD408DRAFT_433266 [Parasitella parasitica]